MESFKSPTFPDLGNIGTLQDPQKLMGVPSSYQICHFIYLPTSSTNTNRQTSHPLRAKKMPDSHWKGSKHQHIHIPRPRSHHGDEIAQYLRCSGYPPARAPGAMSPPGPSPGTASKTCCYSASAGPTRRGTSAGSPECLCAQRQRWPPPITVERCMKMHEGGGRACTYHKSRKGRAWQHSGETEPGWNCLGWLQSPA